MNLDEMMGEQLGVNLIDASQLIIATMLVNMQPESVRDIRFEGMMRHLILDTIRSNIQRHRAEYPEVIICFDDSKEGYWRRDIAWYYKKNRLDAKAESEWDWPIVNHVIYKIVDEIIKYYPVTCIRRSRTEADDSIGTLLFRFVSEGRKVLITSSDSDFTQLHCCGDVKQWSPGQKKWVKPKHGSSHADLMYKLLKGDKKDGVASIKVRSDFWFSKIDGERTPSTATKFVEQMIDAEDPRSLLSGKELERYDENVKLLDLRAIPDDIKLDINKMYETYPIPARARLYSYFVKNGLAKLASRISEF